MPAMQIWGAMTCEIPTMQQADGLPLTIPTSGIKTTRLSCELVKLCDLKSSCFNCERFSPCIKASNSSSTLLIFGSAIQEIAAPLLNFLCVLQALGVPKT